MLQHTRAPIYTVSHYIAYLRRFVADTAGSRSSSGTKDKKEKGSRESPAERRGAAPDSIDPLSYFLRKLKLDLKVSYDRWAAVFVCWGGGECVCVCVCVCVLSLIHI